MPYAYKKQKPLKSLIKPDRSSREERKIKCTWLGIIQ